MQAHSQEEAASPEAKPAECVRQQDVCSASGETAAVQQVYQTSERHNLLKQRKFRHSIVRTTQFYETVKAAVFLGLPGAQTSCSSTALVARAHRSASHGLHLLRLQVAQLLHRV